MTDQGLLLSGDPITIPVTDGGWLSVGVLGLAGAAELEEVLVLEAGLGAGWRHGLQGLRAVVVDVVLLLAGDLHHAAHLVYQVTTLDTCAGHCTGAAPARDWNSDRDSFLWSAALPGALLLLH